MSDVSKPAACEVISLEQFRSIVRPAGELVQPRYQHVDESTFASVVKMFRFLNLPTEDLAVGVSSGDRHSVYQVEDANIFAIEKDPDELEALTVYLDNFDYEGTLSEALIERYYTTSLLAKFILRREKVDVKPHAITQPTAGGYRLAMRGKEFGENEHRPTSIGYWQVAGGLGSLALTRHKDNFISYLQDVIESRVGYEISAQKFAATMNGGRTAEDIGDVPTQLIGLCNPINDPIMLKGTCAEIITKYAGEHEEIAAVVDIDSE